MFFILLVCIALFSDLALSMLFSIPFFYGTYALSILTLSTYTCKLLPIILSLAACASIFFFFGLSLIPFFVTTGAASVTTSIYTHVINKNNNTQTIYSTMLYIITIYTTLYMLCLPVCIYTLIVYSAIFMFSVCTIVSPFALMRFSDHD
jgi:hypothetical protein